MEPVNNRRSFCFSGNNESKLKESREASMKSTIVAHNINIRLLFWSDFLGTMNFLQPVLTLVLYTSEGWKHRIFLLCCCAGAEPYCSVNCVYADKDVFHYRLPGEPGRFFYSVFCIGSVDIILSLQFPEWIFRYVLFGCR